MGTDLTGTVVATTGLSNADITRMRSLFDQYFTGVNDATFTRDLHEKPWVILLRDPETTHIHGFSTLCLMEEDVEGIPVRAFFSGDTIIDRPYWGCLELERAWFRFLFAHVDAEPTYRWFWFLISKGYRTYRYLPVYFRRYFPSPEPTPPFEGAVINRLAQRRFGDAYDPSTGVIHAHGDYSLREGIGDITERERRDPRIAFFEARNPGWQRGDELACLTELTLDNVRRLGLRMMGKEPPR